MSSWFNFSAWRKLGTAEAQRRREATWNTAVTLAAQVLPSCPSCRSGPLPLSFLSPDPSGLEPDSNPYRYVLNSPTNYIDPDGREPVPINPGPGLPAPPRDWPGMADGYQPPVPQDDALSELLQLLADIERVRRGGYQTWGEMQLYQAMQRGDDFSLPEEPESPPEPTCWITPDYKRMNPVELHHRYLDELRAIGPGTAFWAPGGGFDIIIGATGGGRGSGQLIHPGISVGRPRPPRTGARGYPDHQADVIGPGKQQASAQLGSGERVVTEGPIEGHPGLNRRPDNQVVDCEGKTRLVVESERRPNGVYHRKRVEELEAHGIEVQTRVLPERGVELPTPPVPSKKKRK